MLRHRLYIYILIIGGGGEVFQNSTEAGEGEGRRTHERAIDRLTKVISCL